MTRLPRILPLIGVAIAGVLAINALAGARNLPDMINGAKAFAESAAKVVAPKAAAPKTKPDKPADAAPDKAFSASPLPPDAAGTAVATAAPAVMPANADALCLASRAGLSPAEMKMIQDLQTRRGELDQRETDLDTQLKLIEAAEAKLNGKLTELASLKGDINTLLGQVDDKQAAETARLVKVYSSMPPKQAGAALAAMSDEVRLPIAAGMKEAILGAVLAKGMTAVEAKDLTEKLANRFAAAKAVTDARVATAPPGSPLAQQAAAAPPAAQAAKTAAPAAKPKPAPKKTAANTPRKTVPTPAPAAKPADAPAPAPAAAPPPATG